MGNQDVAIFIQARSNSSRLKGKMLLPFIQGLTIPQLLIRRLKRDLPELKCVLLTSNHPDDDQLEIMAQAEGIACFRGSETDVLSRFVEAGELFGKDKVIRVCADNPFLRVEYLSTLIKAFKDRSLEYLSYAFPDGTPIMKSHIGLFAEIMSLDFLKKLDHLAEAALFREHVTNYVYDHREHFKADFLPVPEPFSTRRDIRLPVDTAEDFSILSQLYSDLSKGFSVGELVDEIDGSESYLRTMKEQITANSK